MAGCGDDNKQIDFNGFSGDQCSPKLIIKPSKSATTETCYHDEWTNAYYKYYIGKRTPKFQLPPYLNTSFSKDNLGASFDEMPAAYKEVAVEKYMEDLGNSLKAVKD